MLCQERLADRTRREKGRGKLSNEGRKKLRKRLRLKDKSGEQKAKAGEVLGKKGTNKCRSNQKPDSKEERERDKQIKVSQ